MAIVLENEIRKKADKEYSELLTEVHSWELNYSANGRGNLLPGAISESPIYEMDLRTLEKMEKIKKELFGEKFKRILKMYLFSDGFIDLAEIDTKPNYAEFALKIKK